MFICNPCEEQHYLELAREYEALEVEQQRVWDMQEDLALHEVYYAFWDERAATDPHWPPPECVWWEQVEPER